MSDSTESKDAIANNSTEDSLMEEDPRNDIEFDLSPLPDEVLKQFVIDYVDGKIFTSFDIPGNQLHILGMVFMPIALGAITGVPREVLLEIGCF